MSGLRANVIEEESEATPSGIQSDTPDGGDQSEVQSLPTRDYSSATPTITGATSTWDYKKTYSGSPDETSAPQETSATLADSITATRGESAVGTVDTATLEDGDITMESATTRRSGMAIPSDLNEKDEGLDEGAADGPQGTEEEALKEDSKSEMDKGGVAGEAEVGVVSETGETGDRGDDEKADDDPYAEEVPIESMPGYLPWDKDSEMLSCYQERKDELSETYKDYVTANPELFSILADFLQALFIQKPSDVYKFAREFFQPFARDAPHLPSHPTTLQDLDNPMPSDNTRSISGDKPSFLQDSPTINMSASTTLQQESEDSEQTTTAKSSTSPTTTSLAS